MTGCLETRETVKEQEDRQVLRKQVSNLQQTTADVNQRFQDHDDDIRKLNGRIEALENRLQKLEGKLDKVDSANDAKQKEYDGVYREEFAKIKTDLEQMRTEFASQISALTAKIANDEKAAAAAAANERAASAKAVKPPAAKAGIEAFQQGEEQFKAKQWKDAILDYERYRKANPAGKHFAAATYKIGVAFQELGMTDEAKAFYDELVAKFAKTKEAKAASQRLKALSAKKPGRQTNSDES
jgi:TolA-binding protein